MEFANVYLFSPLILVLSLQYTRTRFGVLLYEILRNETSPAGDALDDEVKKCEIGLIFNPEETLYCMILKT